ncbi:MAG: CPBP family intramembrane glutamic endopeptidase [Acidobacteriota bacterium]
MPIVHDTSGRPLSRPFRLYLWCELIGLFFFVPLSLYWVRDYIPGLLIPTLVGMGVVCMVYLWRSKGFRTRSLFELSAVREQLPMIMRHLLIGVPLVSLLTWVFLPERFLAFMLERPQLWIMVMVLYPVFSVYPQELVYRAFFFHRYERLFVARPWLMIGINGLAFGVAHIFFGNWVAPVMTAIGGVIFAHTYYRSRSLLPVVIEHGIWGDFIFTIGLGWFFYSGSIS